MRRIETALPGVCLIEPEVHRDGRGELFEAYRLDAMSRLGIGHTFVQDNHAISRRGVLRGLHYQLERPQAKLIRVIAGEVFDVAVDVRRGSPTFGQWVGEPLSAETRRALFIPEGFAHGFYVMSAVAEVLYKCSDTYAPETERGILFSDPTIAIAWPFGGKEPILSAKDRALRPLSERAASDLPVFAAGCS
jgi:dTDP-4-dehydrorhamnose 3,5-epimerase